MSEWKEKILGDFITLKRGYDLPERLREKGDVPIYSSSGISGFHNKSKVNPPGVVTGRYGTIGSIFLCNEPFWPLNTTLYVQDFKGSDEVFVYYFLKKINWNQFNDKSAVPGINRNDLHAETVLVPPVNEQKEIAAVLSCLDRKIENLRKQNETLERIAQTLFKHWFVDFEFPNEDGKPYKSSGGAMVRSQLGEIPADWRVGSMEDVIEVRDGTHDSPKQTEKGLHLITSKHLKKEGIDFASAYLISEIDYIEINKRSKVDTYDILVSMIGTVGLLYFVMDKNINFVIKNIGLFKASQKPDYAEYIYLFLDSGYGKSYFRTRLAGTTQSYLTLGSLREMPLIIPDKTTLLNFKRVVKSLFNKIYINNKHIQTLTKTRDVLLPQLMSGKLRIKN